MYPNRIKSCGLVLTFDQNIDCFIIVHFLELVGLWDHILPKKQKTMKQCTSRGPVHGPYMGRGRAQRISADAMRAVFSSGSTLG
jgi:hypothetical protein